MFFSISKPLSVSKPALIVLLFVMCLSVNAFAQEEKEGDLIPVIVTASRIEQSQREALASTTVITKEHITKSQAQDLPTLLQQTAGINITRSGGYGTQTSLFMRGANSNQILVLLDGVPLRNPTSSGSPIALQQILPEQIDRIEIVRGNVSAIYGSGAMGGVIQIFTKKGEGSPTATALAEIGTNTAIKLNAGTFGNVDGTKFAFSATRFRTNGISAMDTSQEPSANGEKDSTRNIAFSANISREWDVGQELGVRLYGFDSKNNYDQNDMDGYTVNGGSHSRNWDETKQMTFAAFTKNKITEDWQSTITASHSSYKSENFYSQPTIDNTRADHYRGETSMFQWANEVAFLQDWFLTVGTEIQREKATSTGYMYSSHFEKDRINHDFYAGISGTIGKHSIQANVRYDHIEDAGEDTTGFLGYGYDLNDNWKLMANASTAFLAPTLYQQYASIYGNKSLDPEKSRSIEGGIQYSNNSTLVRATIFETRYHDLIDSDPGTWQFINTKRAKNKGIELNGQTQIFGVDVNGNITLQNPENRDTGKRLQRRSKKIASLDASKTFGKWYVEGNLHYEDHRPDIKYGYNSLTYNYTQDPVELGSFTLVNFNLRYRVTKEVELFGRIDNVLDKEYKTVYGYNQWGRAFFGGVQWKL